MTVLTVNIHKGFTALNRRFMLHELREAVRSVSADVVFLQEVAGSHSRHAERHTNYPSDPHHEFLAERIWPQFAYGRNAVYADGHHGNAILSKFPISHVENRDVSISGPERRSLLHCVLETAQGQVHAVCVHLGLLETHRRRQMQMLCDLVRHDMPAQAKVVVAGDFNDWRRRAHSMLKTGAGLQEVFVTAHGKAARTFPAHLPMLGLDRIYIANARNHRPLNLPRKPWSHLSDHAPLAAEITW